MMTKRVPIDTYCEKKIPTLQKAYDGLIDYVDISSVDNTEKKIISYQTIEATDAPSRAKQVLKQGDVLVSTVRPNLNAVAVVEEETENLMVGSTGYCVLRCKNNMDVRYLFNFCQSQYFIDDMSSQATGASYPAVSNGIVRNALIPCYPIEEQREIAEKLDTVSKLLVLRKQQLSKLDELVKSRFVEMFGDPVSNPFKWSTLTMKQASIRLSDGPFGSNLKSEHYTLEGVRVIRLGNIGCGCFNDEDQSYISQEHYATIKKYTCRAGEIVIATLGDPNLRACIIPDHIEYGVNKSDCVHYIPKAEILNNQFVCQYINCPETLSLASGMVHGQTRSRISSGQLSDLPIYLPPMDLQQQFASFVEQTDKSKFEIQQSLEKLETLKKALMQKYFG